MVNNAGVNTGRKTILEEAEEGYDFVMAVNTKGVWLGCRYAIAQMLKQEPLESGSRGKIVNIASIAALIGRAKHHAYSASKAAVVNLTRNLAVMYGPQRININAVCPGLIPTALNRPTTPEGEQGYKAALQDTPWPRLGNLPRRSPLRVVSHFSRSRVGHRNCLASGRRCQRQMKQNYVEARRFI
jgi:NAD(P)-dependent dehydrogenase (short-subunit alcohol dehydrogenase family)